MPLETGKTERELAEAYLNRAIDRAVRAGIPDLRKAFDDQARELEIAAALLEELGAEHALEFRRRAYPNLYPRP